MVHDLSTQRGRNKYVKAMSKPNKNTVKKCYLCKETEHQVTELIVEGDRYVCDNCLTNR